MSSVTQSMAEVEETDQDEKGFSFGTGKGARRFY